MKSEGGFIWACKNYDGDVTEHDFFCVWFAGNDDLCARLLRMAIMSMRRHIGFGTRHYYKYLKGEETSTELLRSLRGPELCASAESWMGFQSFVSLQTGWRQAVITTIESGKMTKDLALIIL